MNDSERGCDVTRRKRANDSESILEKLAARTAAFSPALKSAKMSRKINRKFKKTTFHDRK